jgi:signal transduction histidine kinase
LLRTLFSKLLVVLLAFGTMMAVIFALVVRSSDENYHREIDQRAATTLATQIAARLGGVDRRADPSVSLQRKLEELAAMTPGVDLYILDAQGKVLASSVAPPGIKRDQVDMTPVRRYLNGEASLPILGNDPSHPSRDDVFSAASISADGNGGAYLYALVHRRDHQPAAGLIRVNYLLGQGLGVVLAAALFAIASSLVIARLLTRRLGRLGRAMKDFRQSGFTEVPPALLRRPTDRPEDEVAQLHRTFTDMAQRIVDQMRELKRMDAMRRELLADISHDLRTPLTAMQGHLETLTVKEDALSAERKREYLEIATRQTKRMAKLVSKLFELAKLEAHQVTVELEAFALPDLVQDVTQKLSLAAAQKGVSLRVDMPEDLPLAYGDIGLMERVFDNLMENALRHTPAGGTIGVRLVEAKQSIAVEVSDTGTGIAVEDLPYVFDRFFRAKRDRPGTSDRAGVGLALVKNILELHGTKIRVSSKVGVGTTFQFEVPAHASSVGKDAGALLRRLTGPVRLRQGKPERSRAILLSAMKRSSPRS